ncbi:RmlC-like cupin [Parathielavia appendiculata]|uniref:RmlC-like cupin n=1 Tax=Parathielavia appendiculata TaxID=2587402 RepID=A0AAN6TXC8_9PEZI|nr:RmlC-like cupin [Parathielavia appendiculata]
MIANPAPWRYRTGHCKQRSNHGLFLRIGLDGRRHFSGCGNSATPVPADSTGRMNVPRPQGTLKKMASLLPLIQDILPMILPASVFVRKAADILPPEPQAREAEGGSPVVRVVSGHAIVDKTDKMCASVLILKPGSSSAIRHHGEQETILYTVSGKGVLLSQPKGDEVEPQRHELGPGDFAFIPAWTEHQVVNEFEEADLHLVLIRSGSQPVEVNLTDWNGAQVKDGPKR